MKRSFFPIAWLFQRAREFEQAYHAVPSAPLSWPRYFLLCTIRLNWLSKPSSFHGESEDDLRLKFGHDLKKLLKRATKLGLTLTPDTQEAVKLLARAHREHWARYPKEMIFNGFT